MKANTVKKAALGVAVQGLAEALSPEKPVGTIAGGKKNAGKAQEKPTEPVAVKPLTMAEKVRQMREGITAGGAPLSKMVDEAVSVAKDTDNVELFMDSMAAVDKAAIELGLFTSSNEEKWKDLPLSKVETEVQRWANGNNVMAQKLVGLLDTLREVGILEILWRTYVKVVRPANACVGYSNVKNLLEGFEKSRLAECCDPSKFKFIPAKAIKVRVSDHGWVVYLPARGVPEAEKGWPWVQKAEDKAVEFILNNMKRDDTGLTSNEVRRNCKEGTIFLNAGTHKGALLEVQATRGFRARIVDAFGIDISTPTAWVNGGALRDGNNWPNKDLYHAFMAWISAS